MDGNGGEQGGWCNEWDGWGGGGDADGGGGSPGGGAGGNDERGAASQSQTMLPSTAAPAAMKCPLMLANSHPVFSPGHCGAGKGADVHGSAWEDEAVADPQKVAHEVDAQ